MKRLLLVIFLLCAIAVPCGAVSFTAPEAPEAAQKYLPDETQSFGQGLSYILRTAFQRLAPSLHEAVRICVCVVATAMLLVILLNLFHIQKPLVHICGVVVICILLMQSTNSLIRLGTDTVQEISQYERLLAPVMTGALAAQGGISRSGTLYAATVFVDTLLSSAVTDLLTPLIYLFICMSIAGKIFNQSFINDIKQLLKWAMTWGLKTVLYVFTGYVSITGVVSGSADAATLKATKLTISSMVPVVGGILSDASEAVLASAGIMKSAAGIYGMLALIAVAVGPFLRIGVQYLLLKISAGICQIIGASQAGGIVGDFSDAMGIVLAVLGTVTVIFLISTVAFMQGVSV